MTKAESHLKDDSTLNKIESIISDKITIVSYPETANIYIKMFQSDTLDKVVLKEFIGTTPINDLRIARGDYLVYIEKEGYVPVERIATTELNRMNKYLKGVSLEIYIAVPPCEKGVRRAGFEPTNGLTDKISYIIFESILKYLESCAFDQTSLPPHVEK